MKKLLPKILFNGASIFIVNVLAMKFFWYYRYFWFDMPMHFWGGYFVGLIVLYLFSCFKKLPPFGVFIISCFLIGFGWEIFEFIVQGLTGALLASPVDSLSDLLFDISGSLTAFLLTRDTIILWKQKN